MIEIKFNDNKILTYNMDELTSYFGLFSNMAEDMKNNGPPDNQKIEIGITSSLNFIEFFDIVKIYINNRDFKLARKIRNEYLQLCDFFIVDLRIWCMECDISYDDEGETLSYFENPLQLACHNNHFDCIRFAYEIGYKVDIMAYLFILTRGSFECVHFIFKALCPKYNESDYEEYFELAIKHSRFDIMKFIFEDTVNNGHDPSLLVRLITKNLYDPNIIGFLNKNENIKKIMQEKALGFYDSKAKNITD